MNNLEIFSNDVDYLSFLKSESKLPLGFSVGFSRFMFKPFEVDKYLPMNLTLIHLDLPSTSFSAVFTSNVYPGGPIFVGKERMKESKCIQTVVINNKISNVCPGGIADGGYSDSIKICDIVAKHLNLESGKYVLPSSTGIIGWRLPVDAISNAIPDAIMNLQKDSIFPAAKGICTTDRYPKLRSFRATDDAWSVVGIAKGAGMIGTKCDKKIRYYNKNIAFITFDCCKVLFDSIFF
jgi:glutamate N-acetyltransferase/amino-acid N-acetyltransferase